MPRRKKQPVDKDKMLETTAALMAELGVSEESALKLIAKGTKPTRKKTKLEETTEALKAELGLKGKKKPARRTRKASKPKPAYKPLRETKAVLRERQKVYKLIEEVWNDPKVKNLRPDDVPRYIRGIITAEKGLKGKEIDHYLMEELWDLIEIWNFRGV